MAAWGWRIPFLLGALGGLAGLWIRRSIPETEAFSHSKKAGVEKQPLRTCCASIRWKCCASSASPS